MEKQALKKDIRLIALDLDGTTLNTKKELTPRTAEAFRAAMSKDVHVVIATGRVLYSVPNELLDFPGIEYAVTSNGARIVRLRDKEIMYENYLSRQTVEKIVAILRQHDYLVEAFTGGRSYIEKKKYDDIMNSGLRATHIEYIRKTRGTQENIYDFFLEHADKIENININFTNPEERLRMWEQMRNLEGTTVTSSFDHNVEIGGATTSKADALGRLCNMLGVESQEVMACGDSTNDVEMLRMAGFSVAMGNAKDDVKNLCSYVTATNDEDGVAQAIEKFVL